MDQKWTKRQNERPQETPEFELRPFRKQVTICLHIVIQLDMNISIFFLTVF